jgi:hypothetical protein
MSTRRLVVTAGAMGVIAMALSGLAPGITEMSGAIAHAQHTTDTLGPDAVVVAAAGLCAWAVWAWGVLGLTLTVASAAPGVLGAVARIVVRGLLPAAARRAAAAALGVGVGLGVAAPLVGAAVTLLPPTASAAALPSGTTGPPDWAPAADGAVPDWPSVPAPAATAPVPDWSPETPAGAHVVVRGDCLWHIAAARLLAQQGRAPTDAETATAVQAWWTTNASVIGPDPDLLLPGQVLLPPDPP